MVGEASPSHPKSKDLLQRLLGIYDMQSIGHEPAKSLLILFCFAFQTLQTLCNDTQKDVAIACKMKTGCRNNKVLLMRWPLAETSCDLSRVLDLVASPILSRAHVVPSFRLSLGRKLGHAVCQLGNRGTVVEDFSANLRKTALIAVGHLPAFLCFYPLI